MFHTSKDKEYSFKMSLKQMVTMIAIDLKYLEDLYDFMYDPIRIDEKEGKLHQLKEIIKYGKLTEKRLFKHCERCPKNIIPIKKKNKVDINRP